MKLWSRGLGRRHLSMDFEQCLVKRAEDGGLIIYGVTQAPVSWEFRIEIEPEDAVGLAHVASRRCTLVYLLANGKRLIGYLRKAKVQPDVTLEERVHTAYAQVMDRTRASRSRSRKVTAGQGSTATAATAVDVPATAREHE